jgi:uncharacterized protein (TIGR00369 family)
MGLELERCPSMHIVGGCAIGLGKASKLMNVTESSTESMPGSNEDLTPMAHGAQNRCFGCGQINPVGLHLEFFLAEDGSVVSLPAVPDTYEGPPGYLHGGIIATLLDEAMSKAVRARGFIAMTRKLDVDYLRPVPSRAAIRIEGRVERNEGRKHWVEARILNEEGTVLATGKGLFIEIRRQKRAEDPD